MRKRAGRTATAVAVVVGTLAASGCVGVEVPSDSPAGPTGRPGGKAQNGYAFVRTRGNGEPVRWSTCEPIEYVVRPANEPDGARELLGDAVDRISAATGLEFSFAGTTDEGPSANRQPFHPDRYGDRWSPVLVAYSDPAEYGRLKGRAAGFGGPVFVRRSGAPPRYVSGTVVLDVEQLSSMSDDSVRAVMMHELAHVVGLAHVKDRGQLMNAVQYGRQVTTLQDGDLAGLRRVGNGKCYEPIEPRGFSG